jgi:hypothetical protein
LNRHPNDTGATKTDRFLSLYEVGIVGYRLWRIEEEKMLILILLLLLLFGGGFFGYNRYGARGGIGIGGVILVILLLWLLLGGGLGNLRI